MSVFVSFFNQNIYVFFPSKCIVKNLEGLCDRIIILGLLTQWRIQGFSRGGAPTPKLGLFCKFFAENCMKMKEFRPPGGRVPGAPLRSANVVVLKLVGDVYYKHVFGFAWLVLLCLSMLTG